MYWIDDQGKLREGDEEQGQRYGFRPATEEDLLAHNEGLATAEAEATNGPLDIIGQGFQGGLGLVQNLARDSGWTPPVPGSESFGPGAAPLTPPPAPAPLPPGEETFPGGFTEEARLLGKAHPVYRGIGQGLAVAPFAGVAGAAGGALAPATILGGAVGAIGGEAVVEAVAQEYDDAWLDERPFELKRAAANVAMFGLGDVLLRGAPRLAGRALEAISPAEAAAKSALGARGRTRNVIAEAQAQAQKAGAKPARSVGAASAQELNDPFDDALAQMNDNDAITLARDFDDHAYLVSTDIADEMTRLNTGLSESLGNDLKYRDFEIYADAWSPETLERQAEWMDEATEMGAHVIEAIEQSPVDLGNHGKRVAADLRTGWSNIAAADTPARKAYLLDQLKKNLDKRVMAIAGDYQSDQVARTDLLKILDEYVGGPNTRGYLREGLESVDNFGGAAELQKALNAPWHDLLKSWRKITDTFLEATGEKKFGVMGAGRNVMEGTVGKARAVIEQDPRSLGRMREHLGTAFDAYQRLIAARDAHGLVKKEGLPQLEQSIRNLMEDWNLGATLGVAKAKAAHAGRNPKNWGRFALDAAEHLPMVGGVVKGARALERVAGDLHIQKGTALANVWDEGLRRYAKHPSLGESPIYASYSPWMQEALRTRGAPIPQPPGGAGGFGQAARDAGTKVAGAGLIAGSAALGEEQPEGAAGAGAAGLGLLLGRPLFLSKAGRKLSLLQAAGELSETAAAAGLKGSQMYRAAHDLYGANQAADLISDATQALQESGIDPSKLVGPNDMAARFPRPGEPRARTESDALKVLEERYPNLRERLQRAEGEFDPRAKVLDKPAHKKSAEAFQRWAEENGKKLRVDVRGVVDRYAGNFDYHDINGLGREGSKSLKDRFVREAMDEGEGPAAAKTGATARAREVGKTATALRKILDKAIADGQATPGVTYRGVLMRRNELERLVNSEFAEARSFMSTTVDPEYAEGFVKKKVAARDPSLEPVVLEIRQKTGVPVQDGEGEILLRPGTRFKVERDGDTIRLIETDDPLPPPSEFGKARFSSLPWVAGGLLGVGAATTAPDARAQERPAGPSPEAGPATLYREAVRGIDEGGTSIIRQQASAALRRTPPAGRSPLRAFLGGKRDLDAAVDAAREALTELQSDPSALIETLAASMGDLPRTHPSVYMALTEKAVGIVSYLSAAIPERTGQTLLDPDGIPPSTDRSLDFAYKVVGATDPRQAMGDIARLDIPPEELEAYQANWPELWEPYKVELIGQAMRRAEGGRPVDGEKLRRLDDLLGMNGALDPSGSAEVAMHMLAAQEQAPAAPASNSPPTQAPSASGRSASLFATRAVGAQMENQIG